jgi:hypothetical protein
MFHTNIVEKIKTHILYSATFSENRAVYEKIIWRRVACWVRLHARKHMPAHVHPYEFEEKLYLGVCERKSLNITGLEK